MSINKKLEQVNLPDGTTIFCLQPQEVQVLYQQVQDYFKHPIELKEGATVFDVGANIGLFTFQVHRICHQNVKIYAFEPISELFNALQANAQQIDPTNIKVFPCGLSDESKTATFTYYPNGTALSSLYPYSKRERKKFKGIALKHLKETPFPINLLQWTPAFFRSFVVDKLISDLFAPKTVSCELRTISEDIREQGIEQIDLLKIDVEKSEWDVLQGIEPADWERIQQIVIEVHNIDNRVNRITELFKLHGLTALVVDQDPVLKDLDVYSVYARR